MIVRCSPFRADGPWKDYQAPDLVAGALGGSVGVTGDADTPPLRLVVDLTFCVSGAYVGIAALSGLFHARQTRQVQLIEVPVHDCIASSLEHVLMWYFHHRFFPKLRARALERRGSLHWTDLYHVMATRDGSIMITPTPNLDAQLAWLIEENAFGDLLDPEYQELGSRRNYFKRLMQALREWVSEKDVEALFFEAQRRHAPFGWVQTLDQVAANPQLAAREWWQDQLMGNRTVKASGVPFKFSETPAKSTTGEWSAVANANDVVTTVGWEDGI